MQKTKFSIFLNNIIDLIYGQFTGSWRRKSVLLLSLLSGFYFTNNLVSFYLDKNSNSVFIVILLLIIHEIIIRIKYNPISSSKNISIIALDNIRIGMTYALVLEAFKLGS